MSSPILWLVHKDLVSELRSRRVWPETLQLGVVVAVVFGLQVDLPAEYQQRVGATLLWFTLLFASLPTLERSFAGEREERCLDGLLLSPVNPSAAYVAKLAANLVVLTALMAVLVTLWVALLGVPLLAAPGATATVALLGTLGIAAVGTLLSGLLGGVGGRGTGLAVLMVPLTIPVLVAASEATRMTLEHDLGAGWWRWVAFLAGFAGVFLIAGGVLFEFAVKD